MNKNPALISIIIIGHNTQKPLKRLLCSINKIQHVQNIQEIIYVDDGSSDQSVRVFKNHSFPFSKKSVCFDKNKGRVFARKRGTEIATGNWFLFLNSNVEIHRGFIQAYLNRMLLSDGVGYAGLINYTSSDFKFEKYLNHSKRGLRQFKEGVSIPYNYLLFSNCLIQATVFQHIKFNLKLQFYGGEELDFAYKLSQKYPKKIISTNCATVTRKNAPSFQVYCNKLIEFGNKNFPHLNFNLQKKVIKFSFLLNKNFLLIALFKIMLFFCLAVYWVIPGGLGFYVIKGGLLSSVLIGFYKSK